MNEAAPGLYPFDIRNTDTDFRDRLQVSSLLSMMQESAYFNAESMGIGARALDDLELTWMLTRISIRLDSLPVWGEPVWIRTWSRGVRRLLFDRDFLFHAGSPEAKPFGRATSEWLIVQRTTHRPQRPEQVLATLGMTVAEPAPPPILGEPSPKLASSWTGSSRPAPLITKFADFSEIDRNRHVNNTRYVAWCLDAACKHQTSSLQQMSDPAWPGLDLIGLDIHYLAEILPGERVDLHACPANEAGGQVLLIEGFKTDSNQAAFRARLAFSDLLKA
jgi:acyl-ACP thioesterase